MTIGQYHATKEDYRIGSDIEAVGAILFVTALLEAEEGEMEEFGVPVPSDAPGRLRAIEAAIYIMEGLLHDAEAFASGEV